LPSRFLVAPNAVSSRFRAPAPAGSTDKNRPSFFCHTFRAGSVSRWITAPASWVVQMRCCLPATPSLKVTAYELSSCVRASNRVAISPDSSGLAINKPISVLSVSSADRSSWNQQSRFFDRKHTISHVKRNCHAEKWLCPVRYPECFPASHAPRAAPRPLAAIAAGNAYNRTAPCARSCSNELVKISTRAWRSRAPASRVNSSGMERSRA